MTNTTDKSKYNKGLMAGLFAISGVVAISGLLGYFKGEAILFAITNESQVMDAKADWTSYINAYGKKAVELPKAQ